jgi:hypothetical protein
LFPIKTYAIAKSISINKTNYPYRYYAYTIKKAKTYPVKREQVTKNKEKKTFLIFVFAVLPDWAGFLGSTRTSEAAGNVPS